MSAQNKAMSPNITCFSNQNKLHVNEPFISDKED